jgi:hypothetical protein
MPLRSAGERGPRVEEPGDIPSRWLLLVGNGLVAQTRIDYEFTLVLRSRISPLRTETPFSYGPAGKSAGSCRSSHLARRRCPAFTRPP